MDWIHKSHDYGIQISSQWKIWNAFAVVIFFKWCCMYSVCRPCMIRYIVYYVCVFVLWYILCRCVFAEVYNVRACQINKLIMQYPFNNSSIWFIQQFDSLNSFINNSSVLLIQSSMRNEFQFNQESIQISFSNKSN